MRNRPQSPLMCCLDDKGKPRHGSRVRLQGQNEMGENLIPRAWPKLHVPPYRAGRAALRALGETFEEVHILGGVAVHGALYPDAPSIVWMGTTVSDERKRVMPHHAPHRRLLHRITLPPLDAMERSVLSRAHKVLVQSPYMADVVAKLEIPSSKVQVVPVPVDTESFKPGSEERHGLLFVGRTFDPRKNFEGALELMRSSERARKHGLTVVSPGAMPDVVTSFGKSVDWRGRVENVADEFRKAEVFILPSRQEGYGIAVFEALACGTPVVAFRCGGPDQLLTESGGGIIAENASDFLSAVERLLADGEMRADMGAAGRAFVAEHLSGKAFLENTSLFTL